MRIVFDNADFSQSLDIGFKGKHQLPLITVVREYRNVGGELIGADMLWSSSYPIRAIRRWPNRVRSAFI